MFENLAQTDMGLGEVGAKPDGVPIFGRGRLEFLFGGPGIAQVTVGLRVFRIELNVVLIPGNRFVELGRRRRGPP
ncbi:MAG: hypothetical protein ABSA58_25815 [Acetobacteraceae bacterium]